MSSEHYEGVVIYCDGAARPTNPGNVGWGAHGYHYTTEPGNKGTGLATQLLTEIGYVHNTQKAKAETTTVQPLEYFDFFGASGIVASNNTAEVKALLYTLDHLLGLPYVVAGNVKRIHVLSDSQYVKRGLEEWVKNWEQRQWKRDDGSAIPNADQWKRLTAIVDEIKAKGIQFGIDWVKGHSDNFGNTLADKLATVAVLHSMQDVVKGHYEHSPAQGYWKSDIERHPFINYRRLYFNSVQSHNERGHYYIAEPGGDAKDGDYIIGKKFPESAYAVLKLKEPDVVIEHIREHQFNISCHVNAVMLMRLDKVFNPEVYPYIEDHGKYTLIQDSRSMMGINFIDKKPLTVELNPTGLSLRAIENFGMLDELLNVYEQLDTTNKPVGHYTNLIKHDITNHFFDFEEKVKKKETVQECKLKSTFGVGFKDTMVDITIQHQGTDRNIKVPLILGMDVLPRNSLKRIETMKPKVSLLTWKESENTLRYACVIEVDSGIGIWSNYFANRIYL